MTYINIDSKNIQIISRQFLTHFSITALEWFSSNFHINSFHQVLFSLDVSN